MAKKKGSKKKTSAGQKWLNNAGVAKPTGKFGIPKAGGAGKKGGESASSAAYGAALKPSPEVMARFAAETRAAKKKAMKLKREAKKAATKAKVEQKQATKAKRKAKKKSATPKAKRKAKVEQKQATKAKRRAKKLAKKAATASKKVTRTVAKAKKAAKKVGRKVAKAKRTAKLIATAASIAASAPRLPKVKGGKAKPYASFSTKAQSGRAKAEIECPAGTTLVTVSTAQKSKKDASKKLVTLGGRCVRM